MPEPACPICHSATQPAGTKRGTRTAREFALRRCGVCGFAFVVDPWTDYARIYDAAYYEGRGSDPSVDYAHEFAEPARSARFYEWRGLLRAVSSLVPPPARWLDFGCGNGGLVRHALNHSRYEATGFDTGAWANKARASGLPILRESELIAHTGRFDVVTAIEVIEHCVAPLEVLQQLRRVMKKGALLFLTTGNAASAPRDFASWYYVSPEIHVSYFTPWALQLALESTGFAVEPRGFPPGWADVMRFKVLKRLGCRHRALWERLLPWQVLARWVDRKTGLSAHPLGRAV